MLDSLSSFDASHRVYKSPPLVMTLCQVRLAPVLSVSDETFVAPFQNAIRREFPLADRPVEIEMALDMRPGFFQPPVAHQKWRFAVSRGRWAVVLAQDFIALETRQYSDFDRFMERLSFVLNALIKHIQPDPGLRIGLHYIDEIRLPDADPRSAIRPELLGAMNQRRCFLRPFARFRNSPSNILKERASPCATVVPLVRHDDSSPPRLTPRRKAPSTSSIPTSSANSPPRSLSRWTRMASANTWRSSIRLYTGSFDGRSRTSTCPH